MANLSPDKLAEQIEGLILSGNDRFERSLKTIQNKLYKKLVNILTQLEVTADGQIKQTQKNRRLLARAEAAYYDTVNEIEGPTRVYARGVGELDALNNSYFNTITSAFTPNKQFLTQLKKQLISEINTFILQDGLQANVSLPLTSILNKNINAGGSLSGFLEELRTYIIGSPELNGQIVRHARTWTRDALFNYSRAYQQAITSDLGLEFYKYIGGIVKDSREFCIERTGKFFHHREIELWAELPKWQGRRVGTTESSIFIFAGGWNCNHSIVPVDISIVPEDVIQRAITAGYYKA